MSLKPLLAQLISGQSVDIDVATEQQLTELARSEGCLFLLANELVSGDISASEAIRDQAAYLVRQQTAHELLLADQLCGVLEQLAQDLGC